MRIKVEPTEDMIKKLPRWAQEHIKTLTREKENCERQIQRLETERITVSSDVKPLTRICWEYLMEGNHPLDSRVNVRFYVGNSLNPSEYVTVRWRSEDSVVDVNSSNTLIIEPRASNSIYLRTREG